MKDLGLEHLAPLHELALFRSLWILVTSHYPHLGLGLYCFNSSNSILQRLTIRLTPLVRVSVRERHDARFRIRWQCTHLSVGIGAARPSKLLGGNRMVKLFKRVGKKVLLCSSDWTASEIGTGSTYTKRLYLDSNTEAYFNPEIKEGVKIGRKAWALNIRSLVFGLTGSLQMI